MQGWDSPEKVERMQMKKTGFYFYFYFFMVLPQLELLISYKRIPSIKKHFITKESKIKNFCFLAENFPVPSSFSSVCFFYNH